MNIIFYFTDATKAAQYLIEGGENRSVGATAMNDVSSRSHAIFTVNFKIVGKDGSTTKAKFHLVDLAGSERSKKTKATGTRFKEGVKINQGLLALGNVISALGGGAGASGGYISYRDSKLTRLLQDSLGGNSVTLMIACISPADYNIEETLSTLRYADRAKKIKNKPVKNQDSNDIEIKRLKDLVHDLRMKLLMYVDPEKLPENMRPKVVSLNNECDEACKRSKMLKDAEVASIRQQVLGLVNVINGLNSENVLKESFYNELIEKSEKLRDLLLKTCPAEFNMPDTKIFDQISEMSKEIDKLIGDFKNQMRDAVLDEDYRFEERSFEDDASNQKTLEYTTGQMEALKQIKVLEREMKIKQDLLERKYLISPYLNEEAEKTMGEYQNTIKNLEKELDDLKSTGNNQAARRDHNATKVNMDRKHKIEKLEKDLEETRKKCLTLEKTKKLAEQDRKRIEDLKREIQEMKTARVTLIRQQRTDSDRYKKWIATRDKEINTLKEKGKKAQNEMKRMERMHEKQQAVLKRKVEEAKAVNKRLQDAMDKSKRVQHMRNTYKQSEKTDVIQTYIDHELMVMFSLIDAKIAMQSLMNDRGLLNNRLLTLKATVSKSDSLVEEIKQLEDDLEMRNTQIADIRNKIAQTDIEAKIKAITDNFSTVTELKIAMGYVIRAALDGRDDFTNIKSKSDDLRIAYETSEERLESISAEMNQQQSDFQREKSDIERDFEMKLAFMCQLNKQPELAEGEHHHATENKSSTYTSMSKQLTKTIAEKKECELKILELQQELEGFRAKKARKESLKTDENKHNATYDVDSSDNDSSGEFDFNDSFADPDWRKTPASKRTLRNSRSTTTLLKESVTNRMDGTGILNNISETSDVSGAKRFSNGQVRCSCKGSCATKQCGCKKNGEFCGIFCKCTDACVNEKDDNGENNAGSPAGAETSSKENTEAEGSPSRKTSK